MTKTDETPNQNPLFSPKKDETPAAPAEGDNLVAPAEGTPAAPAENLSPTGETTPAAPAEGAPAEGANATAPAENLSPAAATPAETTPAAPAEGDNLVTATPAETTPVADTSPVSYGTGGASVTSTDFGTGGSPVSSYGDTETAVAEEEEDLWSDTNEAFGHEYGSEERAELTALYDSTLCEVAERAIVSGTIKQLTEKYAIVDIGYKSEGLVHRSEFRDLASVDVGDSVEVFVERCEDSSGSLVISRRKAKMLRAWEKIEQSEKEHTIIEGYIKRRTKGGLVMDIFGIEAFLPGSQIDVKPVRDFDAYVDKTMEVMVVKINYTNDNVVVSHKMLIEQDIEEQKTEILHNLEKGQVIEGKVKNITNFGAFIDLGGIDGLLHITDISWERITHPEEVLELNSTIKVVVLDFDDQKRRISLGKKHLDPHPWDSVEDLKVGAKLNGKVVNITDYGAFVEIKPGLEGLVHVSEMSWSQYLRSPNELFKVGDKIEVVVLSLDREDHKMGLGVKQLTENPWERSGFAVKYAPNTQHKGIVRNLTSYGLFVELEEGVDALLHVSDLSWTKKIRHPSNLYKVGDTIEAVVLDLDQEAHRLSLSHKHLEENPWNEFEDIFKKGSIHDCTVLNIGKVLVLELPYGLEGICFPKNAVQENGEKPKVGDKLPFVVTELSKEDQRIVLSHIKTYAKGKQQARENAQRATQQDINKVNSETTASTLGDIGGLSELKNKISDPDPEDNTAD